MIGQKIGQYKITRLLGEGGMGTVYLAQHETMNREAAIKMLLPQYLKNIEVKTRFKNEAATLEKLVHPNIVRLFDYIEDESGMYLIMEFVRGMPLDEYMEKVSGILNEDRALIVMEQILSAFGYAHQQGVVHRDIKPSNILVTEDLKIKILDFGIAKILGEQSQQLTKTGTQMGTVFYMSPEQVQGKSIDQRSDIYSLGVTFYQLITNVQPYAGSSTEYEIYSKIVKEELPNPQTIYPAIPDYMVSVVAKAMRKSPDDRFSNCEEFWLALATKKVVPVAPMRVPEDVFIPDFARNNSKALSGIGLGIAGVLLSVGMLFMLNDFWEKLGATTMLGILTFILLLDIIGVRQSWVGLRNALAHPLMAGSKQRARMGIFINVLAFILFISACGSTYYQRELRDTDSDGITDSLDHCPNESGLQSLQGCPDSDSDGVADGMDQCPSQPGSFDGCPDGDGDGVGNHIDKCPETFGDVDQNGCMSKAACPKCSEIVIFTTREPMGECGQCGTQYFGCRNKFNVPAAIEYSFVKDGNCECQECTDEK